MNKKLRLWNGRPYGVLPSHEWENASVCVAAYSMADARRVCLEAGMSDPGAREMREYWSECWGDDMTGITPERGIWVTKGGQAKRLRSDAEPNRRACGGLRPSTAFVPVRLSAGLDGTDEAEREMKSTIHRLRSMAEERKDDGILLVVKAAERYEFVRKLPPYRFAELFHENLRGKLSFDRLIDREIHNAALTDAPKGD